MKNSKNKMIAAVICGMVIGSIGTSVVGNFEAKSAAVASALQQSTSQDKSSYGDRSERKGKGGHKGEASLEDTKSVDVSAGSYADGTYEGCADGFGKDLKVAVTINSGNISDIKVTSNNETPGFCEKAFEAVPAGIIAKQSTDVDTVSGATYSSVGIINAVNDALSKA